MALPPLPESPVEDSTPGFSALEKQYILDFNPAGDSVKTGVWKNDQNIDNLFAGINDVYNNLEGGTTGTHLSAGMVADPSMIDNGDGSVTVAAGRCALFLNENKTGVIQHFDIPEKRLTLTDIQTNYIIVDYNMGDPVYTFTLNVDLITESSIVPVFTIFRYGTDLRVLDWDSLGSGLPNKLHAWVVKTSRFTIQSGLGLSEKGTREFVVAPAKVFAGVNLLDLDEVDSLTDNTGLMYNVAGVWTKSAITQYNNSQYDDGTDLQSLSNNRYAINWVYREVAAGSRAAVVLGASDYKYGEALEATPPQTLPFGLSTQGVYVGKIIVKKGASTATVIVEAANAEGVVLVDAKAIAVDDNADYFDGENVEDVLQELGERTAAINKIISGVDVVAICYGNVADDDDPNWIEKCADTAWYNEPLNTATRGKTRKFPAERLIIGESDKVTIYDLTDPDVPMWMVFDSANNNMIHGGFARTSVVFVNGILYVGAQGDGLDYVNFCIDEGYHINGNSEYVNGNTIAGRNDAGGWSVFSVGTSIVHPSVNDLAITLLPNAPINPATGMRYPTIAVATDGGVSIIDGPAGVGTVKDITNSGDTSYQYCYDIAFVDKESIIFSLDASGKSRTIRVHELPSVDVDLAIAWYSKGVSDALYKFYSLSSSDLYLLGSNSTFKTQLCSNYTGTPSGLTATAFNPSDPSKGAVAYITNNYNTGLMRGDIQACLMADTVSGSVGSGELFDSTVATVDPNWTNNGDGSFTADNSQSGYVRSVAILEIGKVYSYKFSITARTGGQVRLNTSSASLALTLDTITDGEIRFEATSTTIRLYTSTFIGTIDNISVTEAIPDRCVQGNHAQVVGSLTKSAVASGAELMAFSGFSTSNYAKIPYSSDFDFGTGDFCTSFWYTTHATSSTSGTVFNLGIGGVHSLSGYHLSNSQFRFYIDNSNILYTDLVKGTLNKVNLVRASGVAYLYINGELTGSVVNTVDLSNTNWETFIGIKSDLAAPCLGTLSLFSLSATAPTAEQIKADYLAELPMFQEDAKCALSGSSNFVLALSYDDSKDEATVITDVVDTFNGLVNVKQASLTGTGQCVDSRHGVVAIGTSTQATLEKPEINLREELAKQPERSFIPEQFWFTGDSSETDFDLPSGYDVWAVYNSTGMLRQEGSSNHYTVEDNGIYKTVVFSAAPSASNFCIMGVIR